MLERLCVLDCVLSACGSVFRVMVADLTLVSNP